MVSKTATLSEHDGLINHQTNGNGRDDHELVDETQVAHHKRVGQVQGPPVDFAQHTPDSVDRMRSRLWEKWYCHIKPEMRWPMAKE